MGEKITESEFSEIIKRKNYELLDEALDNGSIRSDLAFKLAFQHDDPEAANMASNNGASNWRAVIAKYVLTNEIGRVKRYFPYLNEQRKRVILEIAVRLNNVELVKWLVSRGILVNRSLMKYIQSHNNDSIEILFRENYI